MEQKKKKGYGAGIVTGILATVLVSLLLLGGFRVITNTAGSYASGKVTEKEVSKKLNKLNALIDNPRNKTLAENLKTYNTIYENNLARIMSYINANSAVRSIVSEQVTPTLGVLNAQYQQLLGEVKNALKTVIAQPDKAQAVISQLQNKEVAYSGLMNRVMLELAENLYKALR